MLELVSITAPSALGLSLSIVSVSLCSDTGGCYKIRSSIQARSYRPRNEYGFYSSCLDTEDNGKVNRRGEVDKVSLNALFSDRRREIPTIMSARPIALDHLQKRRGRPYCIFEWFSIPIESCRFHSQNSFLRRASQVIVSFCEAILVVCRVLPGESKTMVNFFGVLLYGRKKGRETVSAGSITHC